MKKSTILVLAVFLCVSVTNAQIRVGVKGGANISSLSAETNLVNELKGASSYQAGLLLQLKFAGFAIQPEILYSMKGADFRNVAGSELADLTNDAAVVNYKTQNIDIPVNFQFGLDLGLARVYAQAGPYVSFLLGAALNGDVQLYDAVNGTFEFNKYDWGIGLGAGAELLCFQVAVKYDFGMKKVGKDTPTSSTDDTNKNPFFDMKNRNLNISLAYLF